MNVNRTKEVTNMTTTEFQLTNKDKKLLKEWGYSNEDMPQIEEVANVSIITFTYKANKSQEHIITPQRAIRIIGRRKFLSGLSRAAFHWSAIRYVKDNYNNGFVCFRVEKPI